MTSLKLTASTHSHFIKHLSKLAKLFSNVAPMSSPDQGRMRRTPNPKGRCWISQRALDAGFRCDDPWPRINEVRMSTPDEFKPFFSALSRRTIAFPKCEQCGRFHWYPMMRCPHCLGERIGWKDVRPKGSVYTWTVYRHAFQPAWKTKLPYVVGVVEFDDAPGV